MINELKKIFYSLSIYLISLFSSNNVNKKQIVFITSFPQIDVSWLDELANTNVEISVLYFTSVLLKEDELVKKGIKCYRVKDDMEFVFKWAPFLIKSKTIVIDNYLGLLAGLRTSKETEIIQIWHANGAVKKFGLDAKQNMSRSWTSKIRFKRVYKKIDTYVVASEEMKNIFINSYLAKDKHYLMFGYYGLDRLFDEKFKESCIEFAYSKYMHLKTKKIILYVPTYRENPSDFNGLDITKLNNIISNEWHIVVKLHPHMTNYNCDHLETVTLVDNKSTVSNFLPVVDCLVTDYSSVLFDYSVINKNKKLYIYASDFDEYKSDIGINSWFEDFYLNHSIKSVEDLCFKLDNDDYFSNEVFANTWNKYNDGKASIRIAKYLYSRSK